MALEDTLQNWSQGPSETEQQKCANAEQVICAALNEDEELSQPSILVFTQGSYKARTNVKLDSDVDICVMNRDVFFADYPNNASHEDFGNVSSDLNFHDYKNMVERALVRKFGRVEVARGNKAFDIHANSYRIDADVVPVFEHRRYSQDGSYTKGVEFTTDRGTRIVNWPDQSHENGTNKNSLTSRKYKRTVRILKRLRNKMQDENIAAASNIGSFLIESLIWNAPNELFNSSRYTDVVREVLAFTHDNTLSQEACDEWGEVNELKYLFKGASAGDRQRANQFLRAAWDYLGYS